MSMEFCAALPDNQWQPGQWPTRAEWQQAMTDLFLPMTFHQDFNPSEARHFCPMQAGPHASGCEIDVDMITPEELADMFPGMQGIARPGCATFAFRVGGDMAGLACVQAAGAGLIRCRGAVFVDEMTGEPQADADELAAEARQRLELAGQQPIAAPRAPN